MKVGKAGSKSRIISTSSDDVFTKIYSAVIYKIDTSLYNIKLNTKLLKAFSYRQSQICRNDISKARYLLFSQIKMLPLKALKEQLHISIKLVKGRSVTTINIIIQFSLTEKHDKSTLDIDIQRQSDLSILIIKNCNFEIKIVTGAAKFIFDFVNFIKHNKFL